MARTQGVEKLSVSVPRPLATQARKNAGRRGLSAYVTQAIAHEVEREQLWAFLRDLEAEIGPADEDLVSSAERLLHDS